MLRWPIIAQVQAARYAIVLDLRGHTIPQRIRVSWTNVHLGGDRPWMHCPHCEKRVAKLYKGLGSYSVAAASAQPDPFEPSSQRSGSAPFPGM
jgi:hypothetical protein